MVKKAKHERFLKNLKNILSKREFTIIVLSFGITLGDINETHFFPVSDYEIAVMLNTTSEKVIQTKSDAIQKLQEYFQTASSFYK